MFLMQHFFSFFIKFKFYLPVTFCFSILLLIISTIPGWTEKNYEELQGR